MTIATSVFSQKQIKQKHFSFCVSVNLKGSEVIKKIYSNCYWVIAVSAYLPFLSTFLAWGVLIQAYGKDFNINSLFKETSLHLYRL